MDICVPMGLPPEKTVKLLKKDLCHRLYDKFWARSRQSEYAHHEFKLYTSDILKAYMTALRGKTDIDFIVHSTFYGNQYSAEIADGFFVHLEINKYPYTLENGIKRLIYPCLFK